MVSLIKELLDWQQLSPTQFADRIGIGRPVISHILSERNKPSLEVIRSIKVAFPAVSTDWLLSGSGPMLAAEAAPAPPPTTTAEDDLRLAGPGPLPASTNEASSASPMAPAEPAAPIEAAPPHIIAAAVPPAALPQVAAPTPAIPGLARFKTSRLTLPTAPQPAEAAASPDSVAAPTVETAAEAAPASEPARVSPPTAARFVAPAMVAASSPHPAAPGTATPPPSSPAPTAASDAIALAQGLAEPGKAIRRIVIFYRDGSFADYQPE